MSTLVFPLETINGSLKRTDEPDVIIGQTIKAVVLTQQEERVWFPDFGIVDPTFSRQDSVPSILSDIENSLTDALTDFDGVEFTVFGNITDEGKLNVDISYFIDQQKYNLKVTL